VSKWHLIPECSNILFSFCVILGPFYWHSSEMLVTSMWVNDISSQNIVTLFSIFCVLGPFYWHSFEMLVTSMWVNDISSQNIVTLFSSFLCFGPFLFWMLYPNRPLDLLYYTHLI
jgi:hypothetical protein